MIRISRGPEPEEVRRARRRHLARSYIAFLRGQQPLFTGYEAAKAELYQRQHAKCAYCERLVGQGSQPVEHFRPKDGALRNLPREPAVRDPERYWWLAWTWENLLFACATCNGQDRKGNYFPLERASFPLPVPQRRMAPAVPAECFDVRRESPLLIDPAREDPLDHIRWFPVNAFPGAPEDLLVWAPMGLTERGDATERVLGLRGELSDHVGGHIRNVVLPRVRVLRQHMAENRAARVRSTWDTMIPELLAAGRPFAAASHDALRYFVSSETRAMWSLPLRRPGTFEDDPAGADLPDPQGFQHLPEPIRWRLRADEDPVENLLVSVCQVRAWTVEELADLVGLSEGYIAKIVRALVAAGGLEKVPRTHPYQVRALGAS